MRSAWLVNIAVLHKWYTDVKTYDVLQWIVRLPLLPFGMLPFWSFKLLQTGESNLESTQSADTSTKLQSPPNVLFIIENGASASTSES